MLLHRICPILAPHLHAVSSSHAVNDLQDMNVVMTEKYVVNA